MAVKIFCSLHIFFIIYFLFPFFTFSGIDSTNTRNYRYSITVGVLQGGGSLVGADLEMLVYQNIGFQIGAGFFGYGAAINIHALPKIRSSFFSFGYWHQGIGDGYTQSLIGPTCVFRAKKLFTAQFGIGKLVGTGPAAKTITGYNPPEIMLLYSLGIYFPFSVRTAMPPERSELKLLETPDMDEWR